MTMKTAEIEVCLAMCRYNRKKPRTLTFIKQRPTNAIGGGDGDLGMNK